MDHDRAATALWDLADDGYVSRDDLPAGVRERMQPVVDGRLWECEHVTASSDLPAGAVHKVAVQGVPLVACVAPACVFDLFHRIAVWGLAIDETCVMCGRRDTRYRTAFSDEAAGLTLRAFVCTGCASGELAFHGPDCHNRRITRRPSPRLRPAERATPNPASCAPWHPFRTRASPCLRRCGRRRADPPAAGPRPPGSLPARRRQS